jgi:hypothetical protein
VLADTNEGMELVPPEFKPIELLELVQLKIVPGIPPVNKIGWILTPLQKVKSGVDVTKGVGLTKTTKSNTGLEHPLIVEVPITE